MQKKFEKNMFLILAVKLHRIVRLNFKNREIREVKGCLLRDTSVMSLYYMYKIK